MLITCTGTATSRAMQRRVSVLFGTSDAPDRYEGFRTHHHLRAAAGCATGCDGIVRYEWNGASTMSESRVTAGTELAWLADAGTVDPRHVFLTAGEVMARYRWGRTKGYKEMRCDTFPKPIAGRFRLDLLMAWENECLEASARTTAARYTGPPAKRHSSRRTNA